MRLRGSVVGFAALLCARVAAAQEGGPSHDVPPARVGFQMALRTGYSVPMGKAHGADGGDMSNLFSGQVPIFMEFGSKVHPHIFVGGYLGLGFGGPAGNIKALCESSSTTCVAVGARLGAEIQFHALPEGLANPWIGYGIGYESTAISMSSGGQTGTVSYSGFEYAHFMGGIDFRINRTIGIGPFLGLSIGQYSKYHLQLTGGADQEGDIVEQAVHEWFSAGLRVVFFP